MAASWASGLRSWPQARMPSSSSVCDAHPQIVACVPVCPIGVFFMGTLFSLGGACCGVFQHATALYSDPLAQPVSSCFFFFVFRLPAHSSSPPFAPSNRCTHVHR